MSEMSNAAEPASAQTGRPVRVVSISFACGKSRDEIAAVVDAEARKGADLVALPETWLGQGGPPETLDGPTIAVMSELAAEHRTHVVCPMDRQDGDRRLNSAVLLDRQGAIAGVYDKVFPYWSEFDIQPPVVPGQDAPVFETDFGRLGLATCFDVNFPEVWQRLADQGAELVVWPSAYSAGTSLQAHAINHHFYVVSATGRADCLVYDITGEQMLYEKSDGINVTSVILDLDRGVYHQNFNVPKRDKLLQEHPNDVEMEKVLELEAWFVLKAKRPGVSARALAREYGLEELRDYLSRSRREIDGMRGWDFGEKTQ